MCQYGVRVFDSSVRTEGVKSGFTTEGFFSKLR